MTYDNGGEIERQMIEIAEQARVPKLATGVAEAAAFDLAEVWCSECDQPAIDEIDGRAYCDRDAGVAVRAVGARRVEAEKMIGYLGGQLGSLTTLVDREAGPLIVAHVIRCTIPDGEAYAAEHGKRA